MANHITNRLTILTPEFIEPIKTFLRGNDYEDGTPRLVDFNKIKPQPAELVNYDVTENAIRWAHILTKRSRRGSRGAFEAILGKDQLAHMHPITDVKQLNEVVAVTTSLLKTGYAYWFDWNVDNWGTKWGAYNIQNWQNNIILFDTAWSGVPDLIRELSQKFPKASIGYQFADKNTGCNTGDYNFFGGQIVRNESPENSSKRAYEIAFELDPEKAQHYAFDGTTYQYVEEEE